MANRTQKNSGHTKAKKTLGQHFLRSKDAVARIVEAASIQPGDEVLEVGPGTGVLTEALLNAGAHVIAIEKDAELIPGLSIRFEDAVEDGRLELIRGDILDQRIQTELFLTDLAQDRPYKVVANIPYYITGLLFRLFLEELRQPTTLTFLVQKEVAEQVVARGGKEGILSLSVRAFGDPIYVAKVPRKAFSPAPKVDSAILHVANISRERVTGIEKEFFALLKAGLGSRRKMLIGNLTNKLHQKRAALEVIFKKLGIPENIRGEDLPFAQWVALTKKVAEIK